MYAPLFARHGGPNAVQLAAAGPLLAGRDVLVCAPTASGKTEATIGPLVERFGFDEGARVLVIAPTRALVNDLARRIGPLLGQAGVEVGRWTGDHHDGGRLHAVTVLTPEALDARLSRTPGWLREARALVLDELHVLDGTARGDQLRVLVSRLRMRGPLQVCAASATVPDPAGLAARYLVDGELVTAGDRRRVLARIEHGADQARVRRLLGEEVAKGARKVLAFCNSREEVEEWTRCLRGGAPFRDRVFAHHGSLSRQARLSTEAAFLAAPTGLCVATGTLELGLDIGDVDLVALLGAPPDVASLLQRVGRGGRRTDACKVLAIGRGPFEASVFRTLLRAVAEGRWLVDPPAFRPGVLVQQAVSVLHERGHLDASILAAALPAALGWDAARLEGVLGGAAKGGLLEAHRFATGGTRWGLTAKGEGMWRMGRLHANISVASGATIVDAMTGDDLGRIAAPDAPGFSLGGAARGVLHREPGDRGDRVVVRPSASLDHARFAGGGRPAMHAALATALTEGAGFPCPCLARLPNGVALFHGTGTGGAAVLDRAFRAVKSRPTKAGRLALMFEEMPAGWPDPAKLDVFVAGAALGRAFGLGAWHGLLPEGERHAVARALLPLDRLRALLTQRPSVVEPEDPELWEEALGA